MPSNDSLADGYLLRLGVWQRLKHAVEVGVLVCVHEQLDTEMWSAITKIKNAVLACLQSP